MTQSWIKRKAFAVSRERSSRQASREDRRRRLAHLIAYHHLLWKGHVRRTAVAALPVQRTRIDRGTRQRFPAIAGHGRQRLLNSPVFDFVEL
jgi:hypothetical protein